MFGLQGTEMNRTKVIQFVWANFDQQLVHPGWFSFVVQLQSASLVSKNSRGRGFQYCWVLFFFSFYPLSNESFDRSLVEVQNC